MRPKPLPMSSTDVFLDILIEQNEEILELLRKIAPKDEQAPEDGDEHTLNGL